MARRTDRHDMTIAVDWDVKYQTKRNIITKNMQQVTFNLTDT